MDSEDPYQDFKRSMEEMLEPYGGRNWEALEELLSMYLGANEKENHGVIMKAFVDLVISAPGSSSNNF